MREVGGQSELWLVKTGDRIVGPLDHAEVVRRLLSRELAVIDEIARPLSRWRYIREEAAFLVVVEQIRNENMNLRDDTVATVTATQTLVDDLTPTPSPATVDRMLAAVEPDHSRLSQSPKVEEKRYGLAPEVKTPVLKSNAPVIATLILALALGAFWLFKNRPATKISSTPGASFASLKASANRAIAAGEYRQALSTLKEAQNLNNSDTDVQLSLAAMILKVEGQTAAARRVISEVDGYTEEQKKHSDALLSYADLLSNEPQQAIERLKVYSAKAEGEYDKAIAFNMAVALRAKDFVKESKDKLKQILDDPKYGPPARILFALMTFNDDQDAALSSIQPILEQGTYRPRPFQQEALILEGYLRLKKNEIQKAEYAISTALGSDPYATSHFTYEPSMFLQAVSWNQLHRYCSEIEKSFPRSVEAKTLLALCELKTDRQARALELMSGALAQAPQDQLLLTNNAFLLLEFGKDAEAKGSLRLAMRNSDSTLALLLMAKACYESRDAICERESYKKILYYDPNHLAALVGLAELELRAGDAQAALSHYKHAVSLNPSFAPVLRLKEKLP